VRGIHGLGSGWHGYRTGAATTPEKIVRCAVHPAVGFSPFQARKLSVGLALDPGQAKQFTEICWALYRLFLEKDCSLLEINPLAVTAQGQLLASTQSSTSTTTVFTAILNS